MGFDESFVQDVKALHLDVDKMMDNPGSAMSSLLILMPALIQQFYNQEKTKYFAKSPHPPRHNEAFDYIIVGGGAAGSVLANRLSTESNNFKVLLLEAGGPPLQPSIIPGAGFFGIGGNGTDWLFESTKQNVSSRAVKTYKLPLFQGKGLGGSTLESLLVHMRGSPEIYDDWAKLVNDESWNNLNLKRFFKKSENYRGTYPDSEEIHGCSGEFPVEKTRYTPKPFLFEAAKENNFAINDVTVPVTSVYGRADSPIHSSIQYNAYTSFVKPILHRKNLKIQPYAEVVKILYSPDNSKAIGVEYIFDERKDKPRKVFANKEVIICAGALNTPKLLQLSGIGPKDLLTSLNIPIVRDLPVGENFQDIIGTPFMGTYVQENTSLVAERDMGIGIIADEAEQNDGVLASNHITGCGYYDSNQNDKKGVPDIVHLSLYVGMSKALPSVISNFLNVEESIIDKMIKPILGKDGHMDMIGITTPKSRGYVRISGTDPRLPPTIEPAFFSDPTDLDRLVDGIKQIHTFYKNSQTYKNLGHHITELFLCKDFETNSDDYFKCYVKQLTLSFWGFVGTSKMGAKDDPSAVTDTRLKVIGVDNLRVVDASIMPTHPNAHLIPTVFAIAEKAAEMIIQDAGGKLKRMSQKCKDLPEPKSTISGFINNLIDEMGVIIGL